MVTRWFFFFFFKVCFLSKSREPFRSRNGESINTIWDWQLYNISPQTGNSESQLCRVVGPEGNLWPRGGGGRWWGDRRCISNETTLEVLCELMSIIKPAP